MNEDTARKMAQDRLESLGYVHPENDNTGLSQYKACDLLAEDNIYVTQTTSPYATFNSEINTEEVHNTDICPMCDSKASYSCGCPHKEFLCKNGHMWYTIKGGKIVIGDPHAGEDE